MRCASLADRLPMEWDCVGAARDDPKAALWLMASLSGVIAAVLPLLAKIDPRKKHYEKFSDVYQGIVLVLMIFLAGMNLIVVSESFFPGRIHVGKVVTVACGLLFIWMGNLLPKVRSNFFLGFRTPWALSDAAVWQKTQRLGGFCMFIGGVLITLLSLILPDTILLYCFMAVIAVMILWPCGMSYYWFIHQAGENR